MSCEVPGCTFCRIFTGHWAQTSEQAKAASALQCSTCREPLATVTVDQAFDALARANKEARRLTPRPEVVEANVALAREIRLAFEWRDKKRSAIDGRVR